jgi:hypothetical protein
MSTRQPLLEGHVAPQEVEVLRRKVARLEEDLEHSQAALADAREQSAASVRACTALRRQLEPLYQAMRMIFGELDAVSGVAPEEHPRTSAVWESWKQRLGGRKADFIDLLLVHGAMSHKQLAAANHCAYQTSVDTIVAMNKAGIISKNGGKFSLKEL